MSITVLPKSVLEERNDDNNKDDDPDVQGQVFCHLKSDDRNKEMILKNTASYGPDWSKRRNLGFKPNNTTYCEDIMQYLFILICCQLFCSQQQAASAVTTYKYTVCLMVAVSAHFNKTITLTFTVAIQQWWVELCNAVLQYWQEAFYTLMCYYLKMLSNGGVQQRKKLWTTTSRCYQMQSRCSAPSPAVMLQHCALSYSDLSHLSCMPFTDDDSLDDLYEYAMLCVTLFGNQLSDVALLLCDAPTRLSPMLTLSLLPCTYDRLHQIKTRSSAGRQPKKKLCTITARCYRNLHSTLSPAAMLQRYVLSDSGLSHAFCVSVTKYDSLGDVYDYATLCVTMFGNHHSDVVTYSPYDAPVKMSPMLTLGLFPYSHDWLHQIKSSSGVGKQASDRSGGNGKRSQNESSKQSGSAGSNTNSSTTGGASYTGGTGLGGVGGGNGDSNGGDDGDDKDRRWYLEKPRDAVWEESGDEDDDNENCSTDTASKGTSGEDQGDKVPPITDESMVYEFQLKCGDNLYMFGVTSQMKCKPLPEDKLEDLCIAEGSVTPTKCLYEVHI